MQGLDNINLFSIITILSFALLLPVALLVDGVQFTPAAMRAAGITNTSVVFKHVLLAALCFHSYQQVPLPPFCSFVACASPGRHDGRAFATLVLMLFFRSGLDVHDSYSGSVIGCCLRSIKGASRSTACCSVIGVIHDPPASVPRDALHWQLSEARHCYRGFRGCLPKSYVSPKHDG